MPIIAKPISEIDKLSTDSNPFDRRSDGFDPLVFYQMIPLGQSREMGVRTGDVQAEMTLTKPNISSMSNFRILSQRQPNLFPLPGPGVSVNRIVLPERSVIQFTLSGRSLGQTVLEGLDRRARGPTPLLPDFRLPIAVKPNEIRRVAVCYVFDRINRDTGVRQDFAAHLAEVHNVFFQQANFSIVNTDGGSASTLAARSIRLNGTVGKVFNFADNSLIGRLIDGFVSTFPGDFEKVHSVVFSIPVPLRIKSRPKDLFTGYSSLMRRKSSGQKFNVLLLGPKAVDRPTRGGPRPSLERLTRHTLAHELGHLLGLRHDPGETKDLPRLDDGRGKAVGKEINPDFFKSFFHNLMFPVNFIFSDRINGAQVESLHKKREAFRIEEF